LATRHKVAFWTGHGGDVAGALRLTKELLPDQVRVMGPITPPPLTTRREIAFWMKVAASRQNPSEAKET
jgi:hypothetical protein